MLACPVCGERPMVKETRTNSNYVRRRYECEHCDNRFSTVETIVGEVTRFQEAAVVSKHDLETLYRLAKSLVGE